jgi:hypothetical protein
MDLTEWTSSRVTLLASSRHDAVSAVPASSLHVEHISNTLATPASSLQVEHISNTLENTGTLTFQNAVSAVRNRCNCVCVCVLSMHVCMYTHVCTYTYVCMYVCTHAGMYACMCACMYACGYVCMYACMYKHVYTEKVCECGTQPAAVFGMCASNTLATH